MERPSDDRHVGNYEKLAYYYDELLQDEEALPLWLEKIEALHPEHILELASGSALITGILEEKGYDITASDISEDMKEASKNNYRGDYLLLDMTDFSLEKRFDLIFAIVDSVNYLDREGFLSFLRCSYEHLEEGGHLLFDMHSVKRLEEFEEEYIEEGIVSGVPYFWSILSDPDESILQEHFTFYEKDRMIQEDHLQYVYPIEDVRKMMEETGFTVRVYEDFIEDEKVMMIGEKV